MHRSVIAGPGAIPCVLVSMMVAAATASGCDSSSSTPANYDSGVGGPVTGALDTHCMGAAPVVVLAASCTPGTDAGALPADAAVTDAGPSLEPEAATLFNAEGDDDDCKYHVKFMVTAAKNGQNSTLQVTVTHLADGTPAMGAEISLEGYLADNDVHFLPNNGTKTSEMSQSGVYTITPVKFDAAGRWLIRFHLYERCSDALESSPHGHVAFFLDVAP